MDNRIEPDLSGPMIGSGEVAGHRPTRTFEMRTFEERLSALERGEWTPMMKTTDDSSQETPSGVDSFAQWASHAAQLARLSADLTRQRLELQNLEKSLVARIADVDDDRRITTNRLQRSWQSQRDEIDSQVRRYRSLTLLSLLLTLLLIPGAFLGIYLGVGKPQRALADEVTDIRRELVRVSGIGTQDALMQEKLSQLSAAVGAISTSLAKLDTTQDGTSPVTPAGESRIATEIDRLDHEQRQLSAALQTLQARLGLETRLPDQSTAPDAPPRPSTATPATEPQPAVGNATPPLPLGPVQGRPATPGNLGDTPILVRVGDQPYALQLLGSRSREALLDFVRRTPLPARVYYREESYRGRPWFSLIHSLHASREAADAVLATLPPELSRQNTWIRVLDPSTELNVIDKGEP